MLRNLFQPPGGGEGGAPAPTSAADTPGDELLQRLAGQLDQRDAQLLATLRAELTASIEERLMSRGETAAATQQQAVAQALRKAAEAAGAHDVEIVDRLIARDALAIDEAGAVSGVDEAVARLKQAKPFLFAAPQPSGGTAKTPKPATPRSKSAKDLTPAEWRAEKKRLGVRG